MSSFFFKVFNFPEKRKCISFEFLACYARTSPKICIEVNQYFSRAPLLKCRSEVNQKAKVARPPRFVINPYPNGVGTKLKQINKIHSDQDPRFNIIKILHCATKLGLNHWYGNCYLVLPIQWGQALYPCIIAFIKEVNNSRSSVFISSNLQLRASIEALWTILLLVLQTKSTINRRNTIIFKNACLLCHFYPVYGTKPSSGQFIGNTMLL